MSQLFYLRDSRSNVGDTCMFWAKNGLGYTSDLNKAHVYTKEEAQRYFDSRETDIPYSKDQIDQLATVRVDHQYLPTTSLPFIEHDTDCVIHIVGDYNGNDIYWLTDAYHSVEYSDALVLPQAEALKKAVHLAKYNVETVIYPKSVIDHIARRTFQVSNVNKRKMVTGAGIKNNHPRKRNRPTTGRTRGNCPDCGKVTWGFNPYELYTCAEAKNERLGLGYQLFDNCEDVKQARSAA
ncbi:hypothetical protein [Shewanella subflava]|uniref:Uncharacterized protein n=1 Tax=Shewanella subflava TaxID=2986476 RepID=A0ABT3I616_9GAMM|nr:hypothetical protein [Shewanella subflava]MCW3171395.1 hypothetical protein [Shewanella subflava]